MEIGRLAETLLSSPILTGLILNVGSTKVANCALTSLQITSHLALVEGMRTPTYSVDDTQC